MSEICGAERKVKVASSRLLPNVGMLELPVKDLIEESRQSLKNRPPSSLQPPPHPDTAHRTAEVGAAALPPSVSPEDPLNTDMTGRVYVCVSE